MASAFIFKSIIGIHIFKDLAIKSIYFRHPIKSSKIAAKSQPTFKKTRAAKNVLSCSNFLTKKIVLLFFFQHLKKKITTYYYKKSFTIKDCEAFIHSFILSRNNNATTKKKVCFVDFIFNLLSKAVLLNCLGFDC